MAEVHEFVNHISWNVLIDAIENMQVNIQPEEDRFLYIKRAMVATLLEVDIPDTKRKDVLARLDSIAARWLSLGLDIDRLDICEFAGSLQWFVIIFRARESANETLARLTAKPLTGIYADINKIQIHSEQLPKDIGGEVIASLNPIEKTCCKGYFSGYWWQPQASDKLPAKREENVAVRGFFKVKSDADGLTFLLRNNEDIGLIVPVSGVTNVLFVVGTEKAQEAIKKAEDFVRGRIRGARQGQASIAPR